MYPGRWTKNLSTQKLLNLISILSTVTSLLKLGFSLLKPGCMEKTFASYWINLWKSNMADLFNLHKHLCSVVSICIKKV